MKSAFFILFLLCSFPSFGKVYTIANQSGRLKTVNIIEHQGIEYSDYEYTSSCVIDGYEYENGTLTFDGKTLRAEVDSDQLIYNVATLTISQRLKHPIRLINNRVCIPVISYIRSLDTLGICKIISEGNGMFSVAEYHILHKVPQISSFSHQYNLVYFEQVYNDVRSKYKPKRKIIPKKKVVPKKDNTIEIIKDVLEEEKLELPKAKKDDYYDIPRGLNRENALKKKKN